ncbi:MAG: AMP-binding protein [Terracidiphilus sp.]
MIESPTLQDWLDSLPRFGKRRAVGLRSNFGTRWWTFSRLYRSTLYAAHLLTECNLSAGDRVLLFAPISPEWLALLLGCVWRGLVPVTCDSSASLDRMAGIVRSVSTRLVLFTAGQNIEAVDCPLLRIADLEPPADWTADAARLRVAVSIDDTAIEHAECGQTQPAAFSSHRDLLEQIVRFARRTSFPTRSRNAPTVVPASPHPTPVWVAALLSSLHAGAPALCAQSAAPHHVLRIAKSAGESRLVASSALLNSLEEFIVQQSPTPSRAAYRAILGPSLETLIVSGRPLSESSLRFWQRLGMRIVDSGPTPALFNEDVHNENLHNKDLQARQSPLKEILQDRDSPARAAKLAAYIESNLPSAPLADMRRFLQSLPLDSIEQAEVMALLLSSPAIDAEAALNSEDGAELRSRWKHKAPGWQSTTAGVILRGIVSPIFRRLILAAVVRVRITGLDRLHGLTGPIFFASRRSDRRHPVEFLAVVKALPPRLARRVMVAVSDRPFLESHFYQRPGDSWAYRLLIGWVAVCGLPSVMPYALLESALSHGLEEICDWAGRGYCPLVTWSPAMARLATEVQATVVPVRLRGRSRGWWSAEVLIQFGVPRRILPFADPGFTHLDVETGLRAPLPGVAL